MPCGLFSRDIGAKKARKIVFIASTRKSVFAAAALAIGGSIAKRHAQPVGSSFYLLMWYRPVSSGHDYLSGYHSMSTTPKQQLDAIATRHPTLQVLGEIRPGGQKSVWKVTLDGNQYALKILRGRADTI